MRGSERCASSGGRNEGRGPGEVEVINVFLSFLQGKIKTNVYQK
jgi:hypothetical protein